ncbi:MAG: LPS export ABC transporter permease LptF [Silicimonas sp.]|nr:LPS export ABC transporter permease LptF [Silicimonas sp.]NND19425.1 LPS export ABC transporter permease LptF [Silicimonas sp.]NNF90279.1 LPS export ABC transporter permease LptF [Boseongicola sp.]NNL35459.1 LPS export ABC transporter permease LptF [Silicimonas sp.]NNL71953.1 LPS export ABC transporter permease LptF [Silicimonas sp.]
MNGRFDRYLLSQLLMLFGFFALVLVLVYWVNRAVVLFDQLIANGQSAAVFLEFTALSLPNVIRVVLPIAAFAGTVYVANRLTSESELVVVQATGFSPWRLARPVLVFGFFVFAMASVLAHILVPISLSRLSERTAEISENMTARLLTEGQFLHPAEGVTFYIREISPVGELRNIFLSDARDPDVSVTYTAREALLIRGERAPTLVMVDGMSQRYAAEGRNLSVTRFDDFAFDLEGLVDTFTADRKRPQELSTGALLRASEETQKLTATSRSVLVAEAHERIGNSLNGLVAPLIGFATLLLGGFSRFGIWRQIIGAIFALIAVQMLTRMGQDIVQDNAEMWLAAYFGPGFGLFLGFGLLALAANPAWLRLRRRAAP